jgi:hypothetical protein
MAAGGDYYFNDLLPRSDAYARRSAELSDAFGALKSTTAGCNDMFGDGAEGSYDLSAPQSFNRYSYVGGDPVNFTDPSGMLAMIDCNNPEYRRQCSDTGITSDNSWDWMMRWLNQYDYLGGLLADNHSPPIDIRQGDGRAALAETLRHAGANVYYDYDYARAISQMPGMPNLPEGTGDPYGRDRGLYSNYFHPKVNTRCK